MSEKALYWRRIWLHLSTIYWCRWSNFCRSCFDIAAQEFCATLGQCWSDNAPLSIVEVIFQAVSTWLFLWINYIHCCKDLFGRQYFLSSSFPRSFTENGIFLLLDGNKFCSSDILSRGNLKRRGSLNHEILFFETAQNSAQNDLQFFSNERQHEIIQVKDLQESWYGNKHIKVSYGQGVLKVAWRTLKKLIFVICDLDNRLFRYIDVHQYPLPNILNRTAGQIDYSKWVCSSHHWRSNQDVSTSFNSISWNMDLILPSLSIQTFRARSDIYKVPWLFPDFPWICKIPWPISKFPDFTLTFDQTGNSLTISLTVDTLSSRSGDGCKRPCSHYVSLREFLTSNYTLWLDLRTMDDDQLHGSGLGIENTSEGVTNQITKTAEVAGTLNIYLHGIMDALLNIEHGQFAAALY